MMAVLAATLWPRSNLISHKAPFLAYLKHKKSFFVFLTKEVFGYATLCKQVESRQPAPLPELRHRYGGRAKTTEKINWIRLDEKLPDSDTTVLNYNPLSFEPVWLGYLDADI